MVSGNPGAMREDGGFYWIPRQIPYSTQTFWLFSHILHLSIGALFANSFRELFSQKIWFINKPLFKTQSSSMHFFYVTVVHWVFRWWLLSGFRSLTKTKLLPQIFGWGNYYQLMQLGSIWKLAWGSVWIVQTPVIQIWQKVKWSTKNRPDTFQ